MIYYATIVDISGETGISKWDYIHPETPRNLYEHLKVVRDYIPSMTYGIVSVVSKDLFGDRLRRMEFQDMQIVIGKLKHGKSEYYVFFLVDIRDNPKAVWRAFMDFYQEEKEIFDKVLMEEIIESADVERLRNAFSAFLVNRYRKNPLLGARDEKSLMVMLLITMGVMSIFALITWLINHYYQLIDHRETWLAYTAIVLIFHFALPGPIMGFITRYKKHAEIVSVVNGLVWALIVSIIWRKTLETGIRHSFNLTLSPYIFFSFVLISGVIYGATLMLMSLPFACYFEYRYLTTPRRIFTIKSTIKEQTASETETYEPIQKSEEPSTLEQIQESPGEREGESE